MITFIKPGYRDYNVLKTYFTKDNIRHMENAWDIICDHVFGTTFFWREYYKTEYAIIDDSLVLKISTGGTIMFSVPIGGSDIPNVLRRIKEYAHSEGIPLYFCFVPESHIPFFHQVFDIVFESEETDWSDFVYDISSLRDLSGRKYHGQKNHLNRFLKQNPDAEYVALSSENAHLVKKFAEEWHSSSEELHDMAVAETNAVIDTLENWEKNHSFIGGYVASSDRIIGFTIGEIVGDTVYVHAEKADHAIPGAYQFLSTSFLKNLGDPTVQFVNREEDMGLPGLRTSKMSLHPLKLLKKYTVYCC